MIVSRRCYSLADGRSRKDANEVYRFITVRFNLPFVAWMQGSPTMPPGWPAMLSTPQIAAAIGCRSRMRSGSPRFLSRWKPEIWTRSKAITERLRRNLERERISRWVPVERYFSACLRDLRGDPRAVDDIRAAIDELIECRFLMRIGSYLAVLARALLRQGRIEEAREAIAQAIEYQERQGERWCRSELQRVDASVLFHAGEPAAR